MAVACQTTTAPPTDLPIKAVQCTIHCTAFPRLIAEIIDISRGIRQVLHNPKNNFHDILLSDGNGGCVHEALDVSATRCVWSG